MQSVGSLLAVLDFDNIMSGPDLNMFNSRKDSTYSSSGAHHGNIYNEQSAAVVYDDASDSHRAQEWNAMESNQYDSQYNTQLQTPYFYSDGQYTHGTQEQPRMWEWGPSSSTQPDSGFSFSSSSTPTSASTMYSSFDEISPDERSNVYNFEYSSHIPYEYYTQQSSMPSSSSQRHSPHPHQHLFTTDHLSREASPSISENDPKRRFPCLILGCNRRFTSQYTLKVHMEAHKPKPRVSFECTFGCSEKFSRQHDRLRHEVAKHGKVCEFLCDECGRFFSSSKTLGNHKCPVAQGATRWVNNST